MKYLFILCLGLLLLSLIVSINFYKEPFLLGNPTSDQIKEYLTANIINKDIISDICTIYAVPTAFDGESKIKYLKTVSTSEKLPDDYIIITINMDDKQVFSSDELSNILHIDNLILYFKKDISKSIDSVMQLSFPPTSSPLSDTELYEIVSIQNTTCSDPENCIDYNNSKITDYLLNTGYTKNLVLKDLQSFADLNFEYNKNFQNYTKMNKLMDDYLIKVNNINMEIFEQSINILDQRYTNFYNNLDTINNYLLSEDMVKIPPLITNAVKMLQPVSILYNSLTDANENINTFLNALNYLALESINVKILVEAANQIIEYIKNTNLLQGMKNTMEKSEAVLSSISPDGTEYVQNIISNIKNMNEKLKLNIEKIDTQKAEYDTSLATIDSIIDKIKVIDIDTESLTVSINNYIDDVKNTGYVTNDMFGPDLIDLKKNIEILNSIKDVINIGIETTDTKVNTLYSDLTNNNLTAYETSISQSTWKPDTYYFDNQQIDNYICIRPHTSALNNKPPNDNYWIKIGFPADPSQTIYDPSTNGFYKNTSESVVNNISDMTPIDSPWKCIDYSSSYYQVRLNKDKNVECILDDNLNCKSYSYNDCNNSIETSPNFKACSNYNSFDICTKAKILL